VVLRYRSPLESRQLAPGTINLRIGAVRRLAYEAGDCGLLSPWLTAEQGNALWQAPDLHRQKGKRDRPCSQCYSRVGRGGMSRGFDLGSSPAARGALGHVK
jgi:hypothetical protein